GASLRKRDLVATVGDTIFMHAGLAAPTAPRKLSDLNVQLHDELRRFDQFVDQLVDRKLAQPSFTLREILQVSQEAMQTASDKIETARKEKRPLDRSALDAELLTAAADILKINSWSAL